MNQQQGRFFWKLFGGNALLLVVVVGACVLLIAGAFDSFYNEELTNHLRTVGRMLRQEYAGALRAQDAARLARAAEEIGAAQEGAVRVTFIAAEGVVFGDSQADAERMELHADRDEVRQALARGIGESTRFSRTIGKEMKYVALRVDGVEGPAGVVRVAMPVGSIVARTQAARRLFWRIALVILAAAVVLAVVLARMWSGRIAQVTATARVLSQGDLSARADDRGLDEVALLARALNRMRDRQTAQLETIERQRRSLEYLLAKLQEGVVVADAEGRVMLMNAAASQLLGIPLPPDSLERGLADSAVSTEGWPPQVAALLEPDRRRSPQGVVEREIAIGSGEQTITLLARAADIAMPAGAERSETAAGRLLVLTDITELTRTIRMKTDFVANASHELRTPLTAIRAAVDTLLSLEPAEGDGTRRPLLEVIDRHSERLNAIVGDLLDLSRIESGRKRYEPRRLALSAVVESVRSRFAERLTARGLAWRMTLEVDWVFANEELLTVVLDNLVDNAIKFTEEGGWVAVSAEAAGGQVRLGVADNGCGIAPAEQSRVFERFYQVERARTGAKRGTGLGLAIVRHAVTAMGGRVELASAPGHGTRIDVYLPGS